MLWSDERDGKCSESARMGPVDESVYKNERVSRSNFYGKVVEKWTVLLKKEWKRARKRRLE